MSIEPTIQLDALSSLCPSLQPPQGSCFLPVLFGLLLWEAQQIPRGCGSPGSQIPNPLPFPDPPRARPLPQHLFITPGAGQAVWFGIKLSLAGLLPATAVARGRLISHDRPFSKSPGSWAALTGPRRRMPGDGCGRKTATPAGFNHPGCAEELGGTGCNGRRRRWKQGDSSRLDAPWEPVRGELGRRADAGLLGMVAAGKSGCQIPSRRKLLCNWLSLGRGTKSAPQHSKMYSEAPKHFEGDRPTKALAWPLTGMRTLCWGTPHEGSSCHRGGDAHGDVRRSAPSLVLPYGQHERDLPCVKAAPSGVLLHQDSPGNLQEMLRSRGQCRQHGHGLPPAQGFELHDQPLFRTVALQHPLHKAGAGLLPW